VSYDEASKLLAEAGSVRIAILMHRLKLTRSEAESRLAAARGRLRAALETGVAEER
jgi:N-acetylmuramic acid 6-phosphate etherase